MILVLTQLTVQYLKGFLTDQLKRGTPVINDSDLKKVSRKEDKVSIMREKKDWF
jgi:hypothetical protein